jgi:Tfp pilus assembly protein PilF
MRAPSNDANVASLAWLQDESPNRRGAVRSANFRTFRPKLRRGLLLLTAAFCGCNSLSGNWNNQIGMWRYEQGDFQTARNEFSRAVADDPLNASFIYNLACAMRRQGDLGSAEQAYLRAIQLDASLQPAYHALAALLIQEGRRAEATDLVFRWSESQPRSAEAQAEMAWMQSENGDRKGAEQSLFRSLAASPNNPMATARLGQLYEELGQYDRAAVMYRRSLQADWFQPAIQARLALLQNSSALDRNAPTMLTSGFVMPERAIPAEIAASPTNDDPAHMAD